MNSVHELFCSFGPSTVSYSGTQTSITTVFSACSASAFLAIGYISAKYVPLENTCEYRFLSNDFTCPSMVSVAQMPVILLVYNTLSSLYLLARVTTDEWVILCVVLAIVSISCLIPIYHRSLSSSGVTVEWNPFDCNTLSCGTSCTIAFDSDTFLDGIGEILTLKIIRLVMALMSYIWSTESLSLYVLMRSGDLLSVMTAPMLLSISSSTLCELLGKWTFCGSHSCTNKQVTCGHVCSSLFVGVLV